MKLLSYARNGENGIGALREDGTVIDLTARCGCLEVGEALRTKGVDILRDIVQRSQGDFALSEVSTYRAVVADPNRVVCVGPNYEEHRVGTSAPGWG